MRPHIRSGAPTRRVYPVSFELRDAGDGADGAMPHMIGHAAVYNSWSEDLGGFKERVLPGAFDKAIGVSDVRALFNHDPNYIFARTTVAADAPGALALSTEAKGLHIDANPIDTAPIRDLVIAPCRAGLINQMSFSFSVRGQEQWPGDAPITNPGAVWRAPKTAGGLYERDLLDLELFDVSPVTFPAYTKTDVAVRALLAESGVDMEELEALFLKGSRGLPLTDSDRTLIEASTALLRSYLPEANGEEPSGESNGEEPSQPVEIDQHRARLLQDLEHRRRVSRIAV